MKRLFVRLSRYGARNPVALARVLVHVADTGHVPTRYDGRCANRPRGLMRESGPVATAIRP